MTRLGPMVKIIPAAFLILSSFAQVVRDAPKARPLVETFLQWLARIAGVSVTSSGLKGEIKLFAGDVWVSRIGQAGAKRVTFEGGYSWPVLSPNDKAIIAVRAGQLWSVPIDGGESSKLPQSPSGIVGLVGTGASGIVVVTEKEVGLFVPRSGSFTTFAPATKEDRDAIALLRLPIRTYGDELTVAQRGAGVLIEKSGSEDEIRVEGERVGEPSVSHDRKHIVYIRAH
jgi:hypothetical protein